MARDEFEKQMQIDAANEEGNSAFDPERYKIAKQS